MEPVRFPEDFLWGAATSAYQIEGSPLADGAGPSNWHRFSHTPGDVGDRRNRRRRLRSLPALSAEDIELMAGLGLDAYRFSVAWSRVLPEGRGTLERARARLLRAARRRPARPRHHTLGDPLPLGPPRGPGRPRGLG